MKSYEAQRVINGTFGEVWVNDDYMAELTDFNITLFFISCIIITWPLK